MDDSIYTPYSVKYPLSPPNGQGEHQKTMLPEMFLFDYGVVVFWGMTLQDEQRVLKELDPYEDAKLGMHIHNETPSSYVHGPHLCFLLLDMDDVEVEEFHYYYNENCQPRYVCGRPMDIKDPFIHE